MRAELLRNPCILGGPHQRRQNQKCLPHPCLLGGPHEGGTPTAWWLADTMPQGVGGGVGTRPWWLALLACGGAYWPLAFEPFAMTSRHPHYCGHPPAWGGGESTMQPLPMASSPDGLISAWVMRSSRSPPGGGVLTTTRNLHVTLGGGGAGGHPFSVIGPNFLPGLWPMRNFSAAFGSNYFRRKSFSPPLSKEPWGGVGSA